MSRRVALALVEAMFPSGQLVQGADEATLRHVEAVIGASGLAPALLFQLAVRALDLSARARTGRSFADLDRARQQALLEAWASGGPIGPVASLVGMIVNLAHLDRPPIRAALESRAREPRPVADEAAPRGIIDATELPEDEMECDVVVVGTGAGGAVAGTELAQRGHAVVFIEAGPYRGRAAFGGAALEAYGSLYAKAAIAIGDPPIPIMSGSLVGGSTAINTGTCFRPPDWAHARWVAQAGDPALSLDALAADYDAVERTLDVVPCTRGLAGPIADVLGRGCEALGLPHGPTRRNARGCDAQGFCDFGCARGARRSVDLAYLPAALARGAVVLTGASAEHVIMEGGRAVGVRARTRTGRSISVRGRAVLLAAGALRTPGVLGRSALARPLPALGRHLRLQPSAGIVGVMKERIDGFSRVAQGWASDGLLAAGILIVAAQHDASLAATVLGLTGERLQSALDEAPHAASLGVLAADLDSEGTIAAVWSGHPVVRYRLSREDRRRLEQGLASAARVLHTAGASRLVPLVDGAQVFDGARGYRALVGGGLAGRRMRLVSFHPMGTARMARRARDGVVDAEHRVFGARGLYVVDASAIPGPLGVNPQLAIMAMARRASRVVDAEIR